MSFCVLFILLSVSICLVQSKQRNYQHEIQKDGLIHRKRYHLCKKGDTKGKWIDTKTIIHNMTIFQEYSRHFIDYNPKESLLFYKQWIPQHCSYHRFTNESLHTIINQKRNHLNITSPLTLVIVGDSGTRGIYCGLDRLLSGSEAYGPCINPVCGSSRKGPISTKDANKPYIINYGNLTIVYAYIFTLTMNDGFSTIQSLLTTYKPYALIFNTGAWDFNHIPRPIDFNLTIKSEEGYCMSSLEDEVSQNRSSLTMISMYQTIDILAKQTNTRIIYRNNHLNYRYGALCADSFLESNIFSHLSSFEVWDNRNISKNIWKLQDFDGFHYDRFRIETILRHKEQIYKTAIKIFDSHNSSKILNAWIVYGTMEIQFVQSLLNFLFYDEIVHMYSNNYNNVMKEPLNLTSIYQKYVYQLNKDIFVIN